MMTEEQVLFDEQGVIVTPARLVVGTHEYSFRRFSKVTVNTVTINRGVEVASRLSSSVGAILSLVSIILVVRDIQVPMSAFPLLLGIILILLGGILLWFVRREYLVVLHSKSEEVVALTHTDLLFVQKVVKATDQAIESRDTH